MLIINDMGEFINDFDPYKPMRLKKCDSERLRAAPAKRSSFGKRVCRECLHEYEAWAKNQVFCCPECREEHHRKKRRKCGR